MVTQSGKASLRMSHPRSVEEALADLDHENAMPVAGGTWVMRAQPGFEQYLVPLAQDLLPVEIALHEGAPSIGPMGAKGASEIPVMNVGATVACAFTCASGIGGIELPLTPSGVLNLLRSGKSDLDFPHIKQKWSDNLVR